MGGKERTSVYLVGWENAWDWMPFWKDWGPTYQEGWCGFYNIPREAVLAEDNTLKFIPVKELQNLRKNQQEEADILIKEDEKKELRSGCVYESKEIDVEKINEYIKRNKNYILARYHVEKLKQDYKRLGEIYKSEMPYLSLYNNKYTVAYSTGLVGTIEPNWFYQFYNIKDWHK